MKHDAAAFLLWGWAMLLVVLLSAAPTGGPPRSRLLGSAFDPASVSVVLNPKQLRLNGTTSMSSKRKPAETIDRPSFVAVTDDLSSLERPAPSRLPEIGRARPAAAPLSFTKANGPRAPPLA